MRLELFDFQQMNVEIFGNFADWLSAIGSLAAAFVALTALKYAKRAYVAQDSQLKLQQQEVNEDMLARKRLRLVNGPLLEITQFESPIAGLEFQSGHGIQSENIMNIGAFKEASPRGMDGDMQIIQGFRCLAVHNYRSSVRLSLVTIRCIDARLENLYIARVAKIRGFHINFDKTPSQMWAVLLPDQYANAEPFKVLIDFETEEKFFDRYEFELNVVARSIKQLKPVPLFDEPYES